MTLTHLTYAQQDALLRIGKRHPDWDRNYKLRDGKVHLTLPGDGPLERRKRFITPTGVVERV